MIEKDFEAVLDNIPFRKVFDNQKSREILFDEFCEVRISDDNAGFQKYLRDNATEEDFQAYKDGDHNAYCKFTDLNKRYLDTLPEEYFVPNIAETRICQILYSVTKSLCSFEHKAIDDDVDPEKVAKVYALSVKNDLLELDNINLIIDILNEIITGNKQNFNIFFKEKMDENNGISSGEPSRRWDDLRSFFNYEISLFIKELKDKPGIINPTEKHDVDTSLIGKIYKFCQKDMRSPIFLISEIELMNRFENADFSGDIFTKQNKTKIWTIIYCVSSLEGVMNDEWYSAAVKSIGISKKQCSGLSHNLDLKDGLESIIKMWKKEAKKHKA